MAAPKNLNGKGMKIDDLTTVWIPATAKVVGFQEDGVTPRLKPVEAHFPNGTKGEFALPATLCSNPPAGD